ncbi:MULTISPECIES: acyltransferase family protein [unclassified Microbacterium]|uniref:acyltransferase family protein n=1 Tax=unclassified Microbacterium TaxID=2609290 RepID=UPI0015FEC366|nr:MULTISPECIES: acyltransferase family protein [unclassified Microbacterium]MBT2484980.1 acyltransferase family protein [Microbacterium sp. ISL-108]
MPRRTRREYRDAAAPAPRPAVLAFAHVPAIDGARGLAILSVLLYHSGWSDRGLFGVDMFFVVSGFLITLLLIKEATRNGRIRYGSFYARRARRLLPALVITLGGVLLMVWQFGTVRELESASGTAIASLAQVANWYQIANDSGYWDAANQIIPLGQMWSLSVTEQFYIVWPLVVGGLWFALRRRTGAFTIALFIALLGSALVAPLLFDGSNTDRLYLGTDSRAVSFVAGAAFAALVAWILTKAPSWAGSTFSTRARVAVSATSAVSLATVVIASIATSSYHEPWLYQGGLAAVSVAIAVFIATLCFPANIIARPFVWKPFRLVGILAYSMFLLHLPVFWALQTLTQGQIPPLVLFALGGFVTWLIATTLHYVVTEPLRVRQWKPLSAILAIVISFGLVVAAAWYLPYERATAPRPAAAPAAVQTAPGEVFPIDPTVELPPGHEGGPVAVTVIGDSVAGNMYEALADYSSDGIVATDVTEPGCGIFDADTARAGDGFTMDTKKLCWKWQDELRAANEVSQPDVYLVRNIWDANDQLFNGEWVGPCSAEWAARYEAQLEKLVEIGDSSGNTPLILLSNDRPRDPSGTLSPKRLGCKDAVAAAISEKHANVKLLDFAASTCPNGTCLTQTPDGQELYVDGSHFAPAGMALLGPWLENQIGAALTTMQASPG